MTAPEREKMECNNCGWRGASKDVLRAENPFAEDFETMEGCPDCREPNTMEVICDEPGCWQRGTCGAPSPIGYRRTCFEHRPK